MILQAHRKMVSVSNHSSKASFWLGQIQNTCYKLLLIHVILENNWCLKCVYYFEKYGVGWFWLMHWLFILLRMLPQVFSCTSSLLFVCAKKKNNYVSVSNHATLNSKLVLKRQSFLRFHSLRTCTPYGEVELKVGYKVNS